MSTAVDIIKAEIAQRQREIEALQISLAILTRKSGDAPVARQPSPNAAQLPVPAAPQRVAPEINEGGTFTVNGVDLQLTAGEWPVANAIADAEGCCSTDLLEELCGGKRQNVQNRVFSINQKLKAAGARLVFYKGDGYQLENIEEGA